MIGYDRKTYTDEQKAKIKTDRSKGMTYEELIQKYGGSKGAIYRAMKGGR